MSDLRPYVAFVPLRVPLGLLRCPATGAPFRQEGALLVTPDGARRYPVVDGVPILIASELSPVDTAAYRDAPTRDRPCRARLRKFARTFLHAGPSISLNVGAPANYARLGQLLAARKSGTCPRVLVVGGATAGVGFEELTRAGELEIVDLDLAVGPRTTVVGDAHHLPFVDEAFDAVATQAVLEHVLDPQLAVAEIHRVLAGDGIVYSEIPFMAQVHEGAHDVTRYTLLGHRRLYRYFDEIDSGVSNGPGMALSWAVLYFFLSFSNSRAARVLITRLVTFTLFWIKYFDHYLATRRAASDAALGTFFLGSRREDPIPDEAILAGYRGAVSNAGLTARS